MARVYIYVVARDFGFAPNPFHGSCTLATCKPKIRKTAQAGDWIVGMGGARLKAAGRCIFAMRVREAMTFDAYWSDPAFFDKRPVPNGSRVMKMGDNIYHHAPGGAWAQADSHHSHPGGSANPYNLNRDTSADRVLISQDFFYFGREAPVVPIVYLEGIGFKNGIGHRVYDLESCCGLIDWFETTFASVRNTITALPFQFHESAARYSGKGAKIVV